MAFLKFANARIITPDLGGQAGWKKVRTAAKKADVSPDLLEQASGILGKPFNPDDYLLTHCTIVSSVDVEPVPGAKIGKIKENGFTVNRIYGDYRITEDTLEQINANKDAWARGVILKSYQTFRGGQNFCFAPGTEVLMADGTYRPIEKVVAGDEVITHTGEAHKVTQTFVRDFEGPIQALYVDRFKDPLLVTGNHPFRAISVTASQLTSYSGAKLSSQVRYRRDQIVDSLRDGEGHFGKAFPAVREIKTLLAKSAMLAGDIAEAMGHKRTYSSVIIQRVLKRHTDQFFSRPLLVSEYPSLQKGRWCSRVWAVREDAPDLPDTDVKADKDWVAAEHFKAGDFILGPEQKLGQISEPEKATLLGYYLAEGCRLDPHKDYGVCLVFGAHERNLVEHAAKLAEGCFPGTTAHIQNPKNGALRVDLRGSEICKWMVRNGGIYSESKRLHPDVFSWDRESLLRMFAAWMAGDGDHHKGTLRLRGVSVSHELAQQMHRVAELCGIKSSVVFTRQKIGEVCSQVTMVIGGEPRVFNVIPRHHVWTVLVSKDSTPEVTCRNIRWGVPLHVVEDVHKRQEFAWWGGCRVHRVDSNESIPYKGKVHNIEVEEDHSYVVDYGIAVHNCEHIQITELSKGRIIDAVARDVGNSIYVDILIATDRKHTDLIRDIKSGKMGTLSMGCFLPGTQVSLADGSRVAIENVQAGDKVLTHKGRAREVLNKQVREGVWNIRRIQVAGVSAVITATDNHPFYVLRDEWEWIRADELQAGDLLCVPVGDQTASVVLSIESGTYEGPVHNMEVAEDNSYVVEGVAVHNCTTDFTICTKCGHVAVDDTDLCSHIKYEKGNTFYYPDGKKGIVAELCGHSSIDPTGGVYFIEASWVGKPAFLGAVLRNIIEAREVSPSTRKKAMEVLSSLPPQWTTNGRKKAASMYLSAFDDGMDEGTEEAPAESEGAPAESEGAASPWSDLEDKMVQKILQNVEKKLSDQLGPDGKSVPSAQSETAPNNNIIKQAVKKTAAQFYNNTLSAMLRTASSDADLMDRVAALNTAFGISIPVPLYRAALKFSGRNTTLKGYVASCERALGRKVEAGEAKTLVRLGKLLEQFSNKTAAKQQSR